MKKILAMSLCFMFIAFGFIFTGCFNNQEASAVMTLSTNPEIQIVLDQNNKVMYANAINQDGENLLASIKITNKTAEEAAKIFADAATESGKISANTNGTVVNITIDCEDETSTKYTELKEKVKNSVNNYFKDMGIKAGAIVSISEEYLEKLNNVGITASEVANKNYAEIMKALEERSEELKNVSLSQKTVLLNQVESLKTTANALIGQLENTIETLEAQIENINAQTEIGKATIKALNEQIDSAKADIKELKKELNTNIDNAVKLAKQQSETILNNAKQAHNTLVENTKNILQTHKQNFEANKQAILNDIEAYQNSLNA